MAWNPTPVGVTPAQASAGFAVHARPSLKASSNYSHVRITSRPRFRKRLRLLPGFWSNAERDQIANQLLAVDNAPKATAVDGTQAERGRQTRTTDAMKQRNAGLGLRAPTAARCLIMAELMRSQSDRLSRSSNHNALPRV